VAGSFEQNFCSLRFIESEELLDMVSIVYYCGVFAQSKNCGGK
jgi:hypothetical protein